MTHMLLKTASENYMIAAYHISLNMLAYSLAQMWISEMELSQCIVIFPIQYHMQSIWCILHFKKQHFKSCCMLCSEVKHIIHSLGFQL